MLPYLSGQVLNAGAFSAVPRYWYQAAAFLAARSPLNTALVVPADAHGDYLWGDPIDDPLVALASSPWAELGLVPYGGAGSQILLQTAEDAVESGEQVTGLAGYLQRAGVRYLVVRNDLDPGQVGYTSPALVHQTLALSGFTRVASFGPLIGGAQVEPRATRAQQAALPSYPAVEVYAAAGAGPAPPSASPGGRPPRPPRPVPARGDDPPDPPAEPGDHPARQPDRAGERGTGLAAAAHRAGPARPRAARHHRRGPAAGQARAVGRHRRAAPGRHAVRPGQLQCLLPLHRGRDQPGRRRPARPGGRAAPAAAAGPGRRAPDRSRALRRGQRDRLVLRLLDRRHGAGRPGERLRRRPRDRLGRRQRADAGRAVDPDQLLRTAQPAGPRRDQPAR